MKLKSLFVAATTLFAVMQPASAVEERIVASVDGHPILQSQVKKALGKRADTEANRKAATEELVNDLLIEKAVQQSGIKISNAQLDRIMEGIAAQNGITYGQLLDALDYQGISLSQYRKQLTQQIVMDQIRQQAIGQSVKVNPADVESLGKKLLDEAKSKGKVKTVKVLQHRISHILIKPTPVLNEAQVKAKLAALTNEINSGKISFEEAAKANSVDYGSAIEGGDLGWNFLDSYDPAFAQVAHKSKVGTISAPFKSQFGWHILKVTETRDSDRTEDVYLQQAYEQLVNQQAQSASEDWIKVLKNQADVKYY